MTQQLSSVTSINQRLLNLARERREEFQSVLTRYAIERLLYRLGISSYSRNYILKGAQLFILWEGNSHRPTRDLDLLGFGSSNQEHIEKVFREICNQACEDDALVFFTDTVRSEPIREEQGYGGIRLHMLAMLGKVRIPLHIDIGFGDAITPEPIAISFPTLLRNMPVPQVLAYPRETVVAEKYHALVLLGMANTRLKDFYDLWVLAQKYSFDGAIVSSSISSTFERRGTDLPLTEPLALTTAFAQDEGKRTQWQGFLRRSRLDADSLDLSRVIEYLHAFLWPPTIALGKKEAFTLNWAPSGPWS